MILQRQESAATIKGNKLTMRANMLKHRLSRPIILTFIYVLFCIFAFVFHIARHETDKFSALFIAMLTMPWSLCFALFKDFIIATIFDYSFNYMGKNIILSLFVIVNATIIFFIAQKTREKK